MHFGSVAIAGCMYRNTFNIWEPSEIFVTGRVCTLVFGSGKVKIVGGKYMARSRPFLFLCSDQTLFSMVKSGKPFHR